MKINVAVLFGGKSVEHEVSIITAVQAMAGLDDRKYNAIAVYLTKGNEFYVGDQLADMKAYRDIPGLLKTCQRAEFIVRGSKTYLEINNQSLFAKKTSHLIDVAFPIFHGTNGEDGAIQGFLETMNLPYVGCNVLASAVGMDKFTQKVLLARGGFPVLDCLRFSVDQWQAREVVDDVEEGFPYPVIVKPVNLGSSVGIGKAGNSEELHQCLETAFSYARYVVVEPAVENLREINCSVVGDARQAEASECEEPVMTAGILSYEDKYVSSGKGSGSKGMASLKRRIPAEITDEQRAHIRKLAVDAFQYLDLAGVTRVDFLMDAKTSRVWINEVNTIPGSLAFYLWEPVGVPYEDLLDRLIGLALKRQRENEELTYSFDTNILANAQFGSKGAKS